MNTIDSAVYHGCGLTDASELACRGNDDKGEASPPAGEFLDVSAGGYQHSCGVRADGSLACWGYSDIGALDVPSGHGFVDVAAGYYFACALDAQGGVECWEQRLRSDSGAHGRRVFGDRCRLLGHVRHPPRWLTQVLGTHRRQHATRQVQADFRPASSTAARCAATTSPCAGRRTDGRTTVPDGTYLAVSAGGGHSCGLRSDNSVVCWGLNYYGQSNAPPP